MTDKIKGRDIISGKFHDENGETPMSLEEFKRMKAKTKAAGEPVENSNELEIDKDDPLIQLLNNNNFVTNDDSVLTGGNKAGNILNTVLAQKKAMLANMQSRSGIDPITAPAAEDPRKNEQRKKIPNPASQTKPNNTKMESPKLTPVNSNKVWSKFITKPENGYLRIDSLPSCFLFYDTDYIEVKRLTLAQLERIHFATDTTSLSNLIDVISECVTNIDMRELHFNDMMYVWHFIRKISYPNTSMKFTWTSKYGNENVYSFDLTHTETNYLEMSVKTYENFLNQGLTIPRVKDYEWSVLNQDQLTDTDRFAYERAQYLIGESPLDKLEHLKARDNIETLELINEFASLLVFGISEFVEVQDSRFDPDAYKIILQEELNMTNAAVEAASKDYGKDNVATLALMTQRILLEEKLRDFEVAIETDSFVPDLEKIIIKPSLFNFFPLI